MNRELSLSIVSALLLVACGYLYMESRFVKPFRPGLILSANVQSVAFNPGKIGESVWSSRTAKFESGTMLVQAIAPDGGATLSPPAEPIVNYPENINENPRSMWFLESDGSRKVQLRGSASIVLLSRSDEITRIEDGAPIIGKVEVYAASYHARDDKFALTHRQKLGDVAIKATKHQSSMREDGHYIIPFSVDSLESVELVEPRTNAIVFWVMFGNALMLFSIILLAAADKIQVQAAAVGLLTIGIWIIMFYVVENIPADLQVGKEGEFVLNVGGAGVPALVVGYFVGRVLNQEYQSLTAPSIDSANQD